jgi:RNA 3'-phosphate cyclase
VEYIDVDGSQGEGGGQILRTALAFSVIEKKPVRVSKIRAGRDVPGLKRQHVSGLEVLAKVFDADLSGADEGSSEISFSPGSPKVSTLFIDMKTAASITLVLQAVVPAAALSGSKLSVELVGGTDVPWSPTFDYLDRVARPAYAAVGIRFGVEAIRRGYYPRGGGRVKANVEPSDGVRPLNPARSASVGGVGVLSRSAMLPGHVADRQLGAATSVLEAAGISVGSKEAAHAEADSPGSSILTYFALEDAFLGCDALGKRGKPAEAVGREAAGRLVETIRSGANLDSNLADMIIPLLSLAPGPSRVRVPMVSSHLETGLSLARQFTSCNHSVEKEGRGWMVSMTPHEAK